MGMAMTFTRTGIVAGLLVVLIGAAGCGGVTDARVAARNKASKAACDRAQTCGTIGAGLDYEDYPSCISELNGYIDDQVWPASQCQDIKQDMPQRLHQRDQRHPVRELSEPDRHARHLRFRERLHGPTVF